MKSRWISVTCFALTAIGMMVSQLAAIGQPEKATVKAEEQAFSLKVAGMT